MISWREAQADLLEAQAETVDSAIFGLERLDGMFSDRELGEHVTNTLNLLSVASQNLRKQAEKHREQTPFPREVH